MESLGNLIKERAQKINSINQNETTMLDYKMLYERLLSKYEQSLIMIGGLENQISNRMISKLSESEKVKELEQKLSKQEELILDLYQNLNLPNEQIPPQY